MLVIDVTAIVRHPLTGIQRVVLEVAPRLARAAFERGRSVVLVASTERSLHPLGRWDAPVERDEVGGALAAMLHDPSSRESGGPLSSLVRHSWSAFRALRIGRILKRARTPRLALEHGRAFLSEWLQAPGVPFAERGYEYVHFCAGVQPCGVSEAEGPSRAVAIWHDLIPLDHPRFVDEGFAGSFSAGISRLARLDALQPGVWRHMTASAHVADDVERYFAGTTRRAVRPSLVRWGYDGGKFFPEPDPEFRRSLGIPPEARVVVAVSESTPRKRFADIDAAVHGIVGEPPVFGVLIGRGERRSGHRVRYLGEISDVRLRRAYSSCDAYVNWSAAEGFGLPLVEALACGARAIVAPDCLVLAEIGGGHIHVADEATPAGLGRAIVAVTRSPRVAGATPRPDLSRFDWDHSAAAIAERLWTG